MEAFAKYLDDKGIQYVKKKDGLPNMRYKETKKLYQTYNTEYLLHIIKKVSKTRK